MVQDSHNIVPVSLAFALHVILFGSLIVVVDFSDRDPPVIPLAIKGTLVTDNAVVIPPKVEEPPPQAQPEPEIDDQQRIEAERQQLLEDQRAEQERLHRLAEEEAKRKREAEAEAERKRKAEAERRRKEAEAEKERQRLEAERKRQEEIERQRRENERLKAEAEAARQAELAAESQRVEAMAANAKAAYMFAIQQRISRRWAKPPTAGPGIECVVNIRQLPGGEVVSVSIGACNADSAVRSSIEAAVHRASPLPSPEDPSVFDRDIRLIFRPEE